MGERSGFKSQKWEQGHFLPLDMGNTAGFAFFAPDR